jgi:hypothetical protein
VLRYLDYYGELLVYGNVLELNDFRYEVRQHRVDHLLQLDLHNGNYHHNCHGGDGSDVVQHDLLLDNDECKCHDRAFRGQHAHEDHHDGDYDNHRRGGENQYVQCLLLCDHEFLKPYEKGVLVAIQHRDEVLRSWHSIPYGMDSAYGKLHGGLLDWRDGDGKLDYYEFPLLQQHQHYR